MTRALISCFCSFRTPTGPSAPPPSRTHLRSRDARTRFHAPHWAGVHGACHVAATPEQSSHAPSRKQRSWESPSATAIPSQPSRVETTRNYPQLAATIHVRLLHTALIDNDRLLFNPQPDRTGEGRMTWHLLKSCHPGSGAADTGSKPTTGNAVSSGSREPSIARPTLVKPLKIPRSKHDAPPQEPPALPPHEALGVNGGRSTPPSVSTSAARRESKQVWSRPTSAPAWVTFRSTSSTGATSRNG